MKRSCVVGLMAPLGVGLAVALALRSTIAPYDLAAEQAAARAAGIPLTPSEFPMPKVPAAEDASPVWARVSAAEKGKPLSTGETSALRQAIGPHALDPGAVRAMGHLVTSRPDLLALIHEAASRPHASYHHRWSADELLPYLRTMEEGASWLRWESLILAQSGRYEEAVRAQALAMNVSSQLAEDPILVSHLVSMEVESGALRGLEDIQQRAGTNPRVASDIRAVLAKPAARRDLLRELKAESLFAMNTMESTHRVADFQNIAGDAMPPPGRGIVGAISRGIHDQVSNVGVPAGVIGESEAAYLHWMRAFMKAAELPDSSRVAALAGVERGFKAAMRGRPNLVLALTLMPGLTKLARKEAKVRMRRATDLAAEVSLVFHGSSSSTVPHSAAPAMR